MEKKKVSDLLSGQQVMTTFAGKKVLATITGAGKCNGSPWFGEVALIDDDGQDHSKDLAVATWKDGD